MPCYRDRAYCPAIHCKNLGEVDRCCTPGVRAAAEKANLPIAYMPFHLRCDHYNPDPSKRDPDLMGAFDEPT